MGCLSQSACLGSLSLTHSPNSLVLREVLEIHDNHGWYVPSKVVLKSMTVHLEVWLGVLGKLDGAIRVHLGIGEQSGPMGLKLAREDLQSRVKEEDSITNVKNTVFNLGVIRGGETVSNSIFKLDLCKLVIAKMGSAITYDSTRGTESGEERFKKFANNSGVIGGECFRFNPFQQVIDSHEYIFVPS
ncbi:hypothetical protein Tco_1023514 [Tanacetum coccineum]